MLHSDSDCNIPLPSGGNRGLLLDCCDVEVSCICLSGQLLAQAKGQNRLSMNSKGQRSILHLQRLDVTSAAVSTQCCGLQAGMSVITKHSNFGTALQACVPHSREVNWSTCQERCG